MAHIKKNEIKLQKTCNNCYKTNHIVFNFAYIVFDEEFNDKAKTAFIDRLREVSSVNYLEMRAWAKYKGFEEIIIKISKEVPKRFEDEIQKFDGKYSIMRLYKNNEPTPGRIIGKIINKVFYIFFIDIKGELYNHGS